MGSFGENAEKIVFLKQKTVSSIHLLKRNVFSKCCFLAKYFSRDFSIFYLRKSHTMVNYFILLRNKQKNPKKFLSKNDKIDASFITFRCFDIIETSFVFWFLKKNTFHF